LITSGSFEAGDIAELVIAVKSAITRITLRSHEAFEVERVPFMSE
jgi:hypothetical protein